MKNGATALLYSEHELIENALVAVDAIVQPDVNDETFGRNALSLLNFFREYGDSFHHQKEEQLLFPAMVERNELIGEGIVSEMIENHNDFRDLLLRVNQNLNARNYAAAKAALIEYSNALRDHIAVENDEVFPMAESLFTDSEAIMMGHRYEDVDRDLGLERKKELSALLDSICRDVRN